MSWCHLQYYKEYYVCDEYIWVILHCDTISTPNIVLKRKTWTLRLGLVMLMWSVSLILSANELSAVSMILKQAGE